MTLNGYDYDHVLRNGEVIPEAPFVVISGRTLAEYDDGLKELAQEVPVYIRGFGPVGHHPLAAFFKSNIISWLNVTTFYEDNDDEIAVIRHRCPKCKVIKIG